MDSVTGDGQRRFMQTLGQRRMREHRESEILRTALEFHGDDRLRNELGYVWANHMDAEHAIGFAVASTDYQDRCVVVETTGLIDR